MLKLSSYPPALLAILCLAPVAPAEERPDPDPRLAYAAGAPPWLQAVGRLRVPGIRYAEGRRSHKTEDCSATLVARASASHADTIVTAWHCLEDYRDLSKTITFTLLPGSEAALATEATRLADGGGMHADWALLRLRPPVPRERVSALTLSSRRADPDQVIAMAGYSRDPGKGENGARLTWDPACQVTQQEAHSSDSDCAAYKGASGGAVVQGTGPRGLQLYGVISQGNGAGLSTYIPVSRFRSAIERYLR